jgi:hypothetical protein
MELDRLTLDEVRQLSKLIDELGTPSAPDELERRINICEAAATIYRRELVAVRSMERNHGG